jgi:hypothetical protein
MNRAAMVNPQANRSAALDGGFDAFGDLGGLGAFGGLGRRAGVRAVPALLGPLRLGGRRDARDGLDRARCLRRTLARWTAMRTRWPTATISHSSTETPSRNRVAPERRRIGGRASGAACAASPALTSRSMLTGRPLPVRLPRSSLPRFRRPQARGRVGDHWLTSGPLGQVTVTLGIRNDGPLGGLVELLLGRLTRRYVSMEAAGLKRRCETGS